MAGHTIQITDETWERLQVVVGPGRKVGRLARRLIEHGFRMMEYGVDGEGRMYDRDEPFDWSGLRETKKVFKPVPILRATTLIKPGDIIARNMVAIRRECPAEIYDEVETMLRGAAPGTFEVPEIEEDEVVTVASMLGST
jgi:hypothetical protein